jgi:hypothetical protein
MKIAFVPIKRRKREFAFKLSDSIKIIDINWIFADVDN